MVRNRQNKNERRHAACQQGTGTPAFGTDYPNARLEHSGDTRKLSIFRGVPRRTASGTEIFHGLAQFHFLRWTNWA